MIVVDSSVWIDFFKGRLTPTTAHLSRALASRDVLVGDLILAEVLRGARSDRHAEAIELTLHRCTLVEMCTLEIAVAAAGYHRQLRAKGFTVRNTTDLLIGTYCIVHGHTLLHSDRDYEPMERHLGLKVVPTHYMVNEPMVAYG
jgi:predicted nucleic acid-binding protein